MPQYSILDIKYTLSKSNVNHLFHPAQKQSILFLKLLLDSENSICSWSQLNFWSEFC